MNNSAEFLPQTASLRHTILSTGFYVLVFAFVLPVFFFGLGRRLDTLANPFPPGFLALAGLFPLFLGASCMAAAVLGLGKIGGGLPASSVPPGELVCEGVYRMSRHPLYLGASLTFLGFSLAAGSFWNVLLGWPLFTLFFFSYARRIEEPVLENRFGERYRQYREKVPFFALFPLRGQAGRFWVSILERISRAVNSPLIWRSRDHYLFAGYGLWLGLGTLVGLSVLSVFLTSDGIPAPAIRWMQVTFTLAALGGSRFVSMWVVKTLERIRLRRAWLRVGFVSWGVLGAAIASAALFALMTGRSVYLWFDAVFTSLMIAHFFGRIGCLFYGCCYGKECPTRFSIHYSHPSLKAVREGRVPSLRLYPVQMFSALSGLIIFSTVTGIRSWTALETGVPTAICCLLYGAFRFVEEWYRFQKRLIARVFSPAQLVCLGLILAGVLQLMVVLPHLTGETHKALDQATWLALLPRVSFAPVLVLSLLTAFVFSYHRYSIGQWGRDKAEAPRTGSRDTEAPLPGQLDYRDGDLYWYTHNLTRLTASHPTPVFVIHRRALQDSIEGFVAPFRERDLPVRVHYSVKTNPIPGFLQLLKSEGLGVEVVSEYELDLVRLLGFEDKDIIVNGPAKSEALYRKVRERHVKMLTIESPGELSRVLALQDGHAAPLDVGLRICPGLSGNGWKPTLNSSTRGSPYGFLVGSSELDEALSVLKRHPGLHFVGFHMHLGSGIKVSQPYRRALKSMEDLILKAARLGLNSRYLDMGGGFGNPSAPVLSFTQLARRMLRHSAGPDSPSAQEILLQEVASHLAETFERIRGASVPLQEIQLEPGRILSGPVQVLLVSIRETVERPGGKRYLLCDGGAMSLSPVLWTEHHRLIPLRGGNGIRRTYAVLGSLPSTMDTLSRGARLPHLVPGDRLALLDAGAYLVPFNNNFAGPRPAVMLLDGSETRILRRRETFGDMLRCDAI
jgi:diaminopimelate decarboxylase